jgi:hypothetical protein
MSRVVDDPVRGRCVEEDVGDGSVVRTYFEAPAVDRYGGTLTVVDHRSPRQVSASARGRTSTFLQPRVYLTRSAFERLDAEIYSRGDGREVGVWLNGQSDLDTPRITGISEDGSFMRTSDSMLVDFWTADEGVIGHAHTHGTSYTASATDRRLWAQARDQFHLPLFIGLICHYDSADPCEPVRFSAYVTTAHAGCQRAALTIGAKR